MTIMMAQFDQEGALYSFLALPMFHRKYGPGSKRAKTLIEGAGSKMLFTICSILLY